MAEQIECVGGPLDGVHERYYGTQDMLCTGKIQSKKTGETVKTIYHIYHYNPTTNTYQYKGVRK